MLRFLKFTDSILRWVSIILIMVIFGIGAYAVWDNNQIYTSAENTMSDLYKLKPKEDGDGGYNFDELRKINPDVCGWLTLPGTNIDHPVLQGKTNMTYMNKDVYGKFALSGSIFLDTRNRKDFNDDYLIIYGHHMDKHLMFGDLDLYKDKKFFKENRRAELLTVREKKEYKVLGCLEVPDNTEEVFLTEDTYEEDPKSFETLAAYLRKNAINISEKDIVSFEKYPDRYQIVTLVTCASGHTGTKTIVVLIREKSEREQTIDNYAEGTVKTGDPVNVTMLLIMLFTSGLILLSLMAVYSKRKE